MDFLCQAKEFILSPHKQKVKNSFPSQMGNLDICEETYTALGVEGVKLKRRRAGERLMSLALVRPVGPLENAQEPDSQAAPQGSLPDGNICAVYQGALDHEMWLVQVRQ